MPKTVEEFVRLPDESTIPRFRHLLEKNKLAEQILRTVNELLTQRGLLLKAGTAVDATLIAAPTSASMLSPPYAGSPAPSNGFTFQARFCWAWHWAAAPGCASTS